MLLSSKILLLLLEQFWEYVQTELLFDWLIKQHWETYNYIGRRAHIQMTYLKIAIAIVSGLARVLYEPLFIAWGEPLPNEGNLCIYRQIRISLD